MPTKQCGKTGSDDGKEAFLKSPAFFLVNCSLTKILEPFKVKGSRIFVDEQLTKKNAGLFKKARELRRNGVIDSTWTYNGRVFVKKTQTATSEEIRVEDDLQSFSRK